MSGWFSSKDVLHNISNITGQIKTITKDIVHDVISTDGMTTTLEAENEHELTKKLKEIELKCQALTEENQQLKQQHDAYHSSRVNQGDNIHNIQQKTTVAGIVENDLTRPSPLDQAVRMNNLLSSNDQDLVDALNRDLSSLNQEFDKLATIVDNRKLDGSLKLVNSGVGTSFDMNSEPERTQHAQRDRDLVVEAIGKDCREIVQFLDAMDVVAKLNVDMFHEKSDRLPEFVKHLTETISLALKQCAERRNQNRGEIVRLTSEVNRLKMHLVETNDVHDKDIRQTFIQTEQAEAEIRRLLDRLAETESRCESVQETLVSQTKEFAHSQDVFLESKTALRKKLDHQQRLSSNLQAALSRLNDENDRQLRSIKGSHQEEIQQMREKLKSLQNSAEETELKKVSSPAADDDTSASACEIYHRYDKELRYLRRALSEKEAHCTALEATLKNLSPATGNRIEKSLVRDILMSFFHTDDARKPEAIGPICSLLEFDPEQTDNLRRILLPAQGWFSWVSTASTPTAISTTDHPSNDRSLAELLIEYVDKKDRPEVRLKFDLSSGERIQAEEELKSPGLENH